MKIRIVNVNESYIKVNCEPSIAYEISDAFTFMVPGAHFSPKYRSRIWDGKIRLFSVATGLLYRGLVQKLIDFCVDRDYEYVYDNESYDTEFSLKEAEEYIKKLNPVHDARDYQIDGFMHAIRMGRSIMLSPTASGKSFIIYLIVNYLLEKQGHERGLVIVPKISLVEQLYTDFEDYSVNNKFDTEKMCHKIYQGADKKSTKPITISTWQSIYTLPKSYFHQFDFVIGDEAHEFKAKSLIHIMTNLENASFRLGTTGTLDGTKTHEWVLEGLFGPTRRVISTKELMDQKHVADFNIKCLLLKHPEEACKAAKKFSYQEEMDYIVRNENRNNFIKNLALSLKGNTLVLYQYVEKHGNILFNLINSENKGRKVYFVHGGTKVQIREQIRGIVEKENDAIIVASYGTFSTGINIRNLHNVIFASSYKSRIKNLQSIGRSLRKSDTKSKATLYDIADDLKYKNRENYTLKQFSIRLQLYMEEQFDFKLYKISLKG